VSEWSQIPNPRGKQGGSIPTPDFARSQSTNNQKVVFSFEVFDSVVECPSAWGPEIRSLFSAFKKASERTWHQVQQSGGKGANKTGLGFTTINPPPFPLPPALSKDLSISEMRAGEKARFFGARFGATYYVIRLDKSHQVCG
jgi:hypothetical protein